MLVSPDGTLVGSLSGGCLEEEVAQRAAEVLRTGKPALMSFDTRRRFGCNGSIDIFLEVADPAFFETLSAALHQRRTCRAVTVFEGSEEELGSRIRASGEPLPQGAFAQEISPTVHLIIFGEGPDSQPLRSIAQLLGWSVAEVDQASDLPASVDCRTAVVIKSHNYGRDCAALQQFLPLGLRYVGLLGPRKRRDQLLGDLLDHGTAFNAELFAPAGLDLNAETPEEIALSIAAEIQAVFAQGTGESLRARKAPIHGWEPAADVNTQAIACELSAR